ncbi:MAG: NTP transferase domain-containing protein [Pseudomonadota bacterium]|nr:NTP transferase domain-containing protein [Pseudomonadota bacterium]MEC8955548.1 NTP transferase domain-containing protein [Pseudomonadota bacterium]
MTNHRQIWGLILSGGESRRMGQDKALLKFEGVTQLNKVYSLLAAHLSQVFISSRNDQSDNDERKKYNQIIDRYDNLGPIAGILSAMQEHPGVDWLVVACDLINLDSHTLSYLIENYSAEYDFVAYKSEHDGLPEPLCAIYGSMAQEIIQRRLKDKVICPRKILIKSNTYLLSQPNPRALDNFNTPGDFTAQNMELNHE